MQCADRKNRSFISEKLGAVVHRIGWPSGKDDPHLGYARAQQFRADSKQQLFHPLLEAFGDGYTNLVPSIKNQDVGTNGRPVLSILHFFTKDRAVLEYLCDG